MCFIKQQLVSIQAPCLNADVLRSCLAFSNKRKWAGGVKNTNFVFSAFGEGAFCT